MELKNWAIALSASSLLFLALAVLTGGIVFYAAFAAAMAAFAIDFFRYASVRSELARMLTVDKHLSKTDILLGSAMTVTYALEYVGQRRVPLECRQQAEGQVHVKEGSVRVDLSPGQQSLAFTVTPAGRGTHTVRGLGMTIESLFFRGTLVAGGDDEINVYPPITARPGRASGRNALDRIVGNEAIREGSGADFSRLREYTPGDSVRNIDWARTSKYGRLVVKDFEDVRSMPVFMLIDVDVSMGTGATKSELESAVELMTLLSGRVLLENERAGIACFSSSEVTACLPLAGGQDQMTRIRQFLASVKAIRGAIEPRGGGPALFDAVAAQKAFGKEANLDAFNAIMEEAIRQFSVNAREDGLIKAIFKISHMSNIPCHIIVATNLSMGMSSLLNGVRIARYYGHNVTVALTPHVWYEPPENVDAERYYRKYRETMDSIACLRSQHVTVIELSAAERPEEAIRAGHVRQAARAVR